MHRDFWSSQEEKYNERDSLHRKKDTDFTKDPDIGIILPLILLLMSDGGDEMLIMALIYILS